MLNEGRAKYRVCSVPTRRFGSEDGRHFPRPLFQNTSRCLCHRGWRNVNSLFLPPIHQRVAEGLCSARFQSGPHCVPSITAGDSKKKSSIYRLAGSQHSDSSGFCDWGASQFDAWLGLSVGSPLTGSRNVTQTPDPVNELVNVVA